MRKFLTVILFDTQRIYCYSYPTSCIILKQTIMITFSLLDAVFALCAAFVVSCVLLFTVYQMIKFAERKKQEKLKKQQQQEFMENIAKEEARMREYARNASLGDLQVQAIFLQRILENGGSFREARLKRIVDDEINNRKQKGGI